MFRRNAVESNPCSAKKSLPPVTNHPAFCFDYAMNARQLKRQRNRGLGYDGIIPMTTEGDPQRSNVFRLAQLRPTTKMLADGKNH